MPTVPTYDTAQVLPGVSPAPYRQGNAPDTAIGARQMGALGETVQNVGAFLSQEEVNAQGMANQVMVDGAKNQALQEQLARTYDPDTGFLNKKGAAALAPDPLGRSLSQRYTEEFQDKLKEISGGLGNDAQRRVFNEQAASMATSFGGDVQRHMLQEFRSYGMETQQGAIKLAADAAKLAWDNPDKIGEQIKSASAAVWKAGQINGEPGSLTTAKIKETTSAIHSGVIAAALENNNPAQALAHIEAKKGEMTADDLLKVNSAIKSDVRARVATSTAQSAMDDVQRGASPPQAVHIMNAAGVTDNTKDVHAATYVNALATKYAGDSTKVLAATAIDADVVDAAIKSAGKGGDWVSKLSTADQAKLATAVDAYNKPPIPTIPSQQDVHTSIRAKLGPNPDPRVLAAALAEGTRMYADFQADRKVKGENAMQAAQQWLIQNNGAMAALPPNLAQAVTQAAPDKFDNLIEFSKKVAKGENVTNMPAYLDAVANPGELAKMPQSVFNHFVTTQFSQTDGKRIAALRQSEIDGKEDMSSGAVNRPALNTALNSRLEAIGVDPKPKSLEEKARVGSIQKFVTDGIFAQQKQLGRKMTAQEVGDFVDQTMAKNLSFKSTFLGFIPAGSSQTPLLGMKSGDIPDDALKQIRASFAARGNTKPTEDQIMRTYWNVKNAR
ncbi:hypothetical protein [Massilia sp. PWRC2]|uniref:hypothetical protein n=1 Tax=Massilia sp. PWRC2 TaxID=2804626 RepID=UPI003CFB0CCC